MFAARARRIIRDRHVTSPYFPAFISDFAASGGEQLRKKTIPNCHQMHDFARGQNEKWMRDVHKLACASPDSNDNGNHCTEEFADPLT
jgi:hypothetical protein